MDTKDRVRRNLNQGWMWVLGILVALFFTQACSSIAYVQLNDRLPAKASALVDKEVFRLRIENEGFEIVPEKKASQVELVFVLQEFSLDLVDRTWKVRLGYEARLVKNGAVLSKQFANGEAERQKIMGTEQADAVVGDLFVDVMNRLNVEKLFREPGL